MTENNIYQLIKNLAEREKLAEKDIIEMLSLAIQDICRQKNTISGDLQVTFDPEKKQFLAYQVYQIVDQINNPDKEILNDDQLFQDEKNFRQGERLFQSLDLKKIINYEEILAHFRLSLQNSRQKKWAEEFLPLQGKIIEGTVQEVYHNYCLVSLRSGKGLGYWGRNEWLSRESPRSGQSHRFLVQETAAAGKYPVILARRSEEFLRKLLEIEIPRIAQKKIIIQDILRLPGVVSKVLINSKFPMNNLLGACLGEKGIRAQIIEKEMNPERIHLVEWKEDKKEQLVKLFSPVEVLGFCKLPKKSDLVVIVHPEKKNSLVKGKIVPLIEDYLKIKLQIRTWEEMDKENAIIMETANKSKENWANTKFDHKLYGPKQ